MGNRPPPIVMDCGTGFSKIGFACNRKPSVVLPTVVATPEHGDQGRLLIGEAAECADRRVYHVSQPIDNGIVRDWDWMERFLHQCMYRCAPALLPAPRLPPGPARAPRRSARVLTLPPRLCGRRQLRVSPEEHQFVLTESPLAPPESREAVAEVMFETFNAGGLFIGNSAMLALYASYAMANRKQDASGGQALTGTVVDAGESATHIVPVVDGYVMSSAIRVLPVGGAAMTRAVQQQLQQQMAAVSAAHAWDAARKVKEALCFVCQETKQLDPAGGECSYTYRAGSGGSQHSFSLGSRQRCMAPELLFSPPGLQGSGMATPLPQLLDQAVQACPIDSRRPLYGNIVLSGGVGALKGLGSRLQAEVAALTAARLGAMGSRVIEVAVRSPVPPQQATWFGGSVVAMAPQFSKACHSRQEYEEYGAAVCRNNFLDDR